MNALNLKEKVNGLKERINLPLSLVVVSVLLTAFFIAVTPGFIGYENITFPKAPVDYQFEFDSLVKVYILDNGRMFLGGRELADVTELSDLLDGTACKKKIGKIALLAGANTEYGKITSVLNALKQAKVNSVFLTYGGSASWLDIMNGADL